MRTHSTNHPSANGTASNRATANPITVERDPRPLAGGMGFTFEGPCWPLGRPASIPVPPCESLSLGGSRGVAQLSSELSGALMTFERRVVQRVTGG